MRKPRALAAWLVVAPLLPGCTALRAPACPDGSDPMIETTLYFGTETPEGTVQAQDWRRFVDDVVTPRFPVGLTHWTASGQWRGADGDIVREGAHVLALLHPDDAAAAALDEIVTRYKAQFRQEAVLRVRSAACVSF